MQRSSSRRFAWLIAVLAAFVVGAVPASAAPDNSYSVHALTSNVTGAAANPDPNLVNAWGLTAGPSTPWWVSDNGTNQSTLYTADGTPQTRVVSVPGGPTGAAFWSFSAPAFFVFSTEGGQILGWNSSQGNDTVVLADHSAEGAIYKEIREKGDLPDELVEKINAAIDKFKNTFSVTEESALA